uniref:Uncharacterized protein n=1 Tax=Anopheles minimus TaxID=112268 RepID=A0A182W6B2_9DIPT
MLLENLHYNFRETAQEMNMAHETVRHILFDVLGMRKVAARLVPNNLIFCQKVNRSKVAEDMIERVMLTVLFNIRGVVHLEFLPEDQTVNKEYYLGVMTRLKENVRRQRPDLKRNNG